MGGVSIIYLTSQHFLSSSLVKSEPAWLHPEDTKFKGKSASFMIKLQPNEAAGGNICTVCINCALRDRDSGSSAECVYSIKLISGVINDTTEEVDTQGRRSRCKESADMFFDQF